MNEIEYLYISPEEEQKILERRKTIGLYGTAGIFLAGLVYLLL